MYKLKIINFKPYEYELFETQLNQLGQQGYKTNDLSLLTVFKKTDQSYYYKIDFHIPEGKTRSEKFASKQKFFDPYLDEGYEAIYNKNNMYVFIGNQASKQKINFNKKKEFINEKKTFKTLNALIASLIISLAFIILSTLAITIDTFLSYGMTFIFIGIILGCLTMLYRCSCNFYFTNQLKKKLHQTKYNLSSGFLHKLRKVYAILVCLVTLLIIGGLVEDTLNAQSFDIEDHPILLLKDLNITEESTLETQVRSSFTVPHSYTSLELAEDNSTLFIKEYDLSDDEAAQTLIESFAKNPQQYYCTSVKQKDNILYGYTDNDLTSLIIQKENRVTLISPGFELTDQHIQIIINFYN